MIAVGVPRWGSSTPAGCGRHVGFRDAQPISATFDLSVADVRIIAGDRADTIVEVRPTNQTRNSDIKAAEQTRVEYSNGRLSVKMAKDWTRFTPFGGVASVDITIELPYRLRNS